MRQFKVYRHPSGALEGVQPGWSWPAFFLGGLWGLHRKMWWLAVTEMSWMAGLWMLPEEAVLMAAAVPVGHLLTGWRSHAWLVRHLQQQGYRHVDTVTAQDRGSALALSIRQRGWRVPGAVSP